MQTIDKIIDVGRALGAVLVVIGMFEYVAGDERNGTPDRPVMVLVHQHIL